MKRALLLTTLAALALPSVGGAQQHKPYPTIARVSRTCGLIRTDIIGERPVQVTVYRGKASCAEARRIASKFQGRHPGPFHGTDLASGYWIVYGWKCQRDTGGESGCTRGADNMIVMQEEVPVYLACQITSLPVPGNRALSIEIGEAEMATIYREDPASWRSRSAAPCELANRIASAAYGAIAGSGSHTFVAEGTGWYAGRFTCAYTIGPGEHPYTYWACIHPGEGVTTVRFQSGPAN
jgi:hypothetical protein